MIEFKKGKKVTLAFNIQNTTKHQVWTITNVGEDTGFVEIRAIKNGYYQYLYVYDSALVLI